MSVTLKRQESQWSIRLDGHSALASAVELKDALVEWLAAGTNLELDLEAVDEIDIAILQLLWAVTREATRTGVEVVGRASSAVLIAARDAGFAQMPGFQVPE